MDITGQLPDMDAYAITCIRCRVRGLVSRGLLPRDEFEDACSELYCDFLRRKSRYDPDRSHYKTFAARVVRNMVSTFSVRSLRSGRKQLRWKSLSMDDGAVSDLSDEFRSAERLPNNIAVQQALDLFPVELRNLAIMLSSESLTEISRRTGTPRSSLYRRKAAIRAELERHGFN
jgi:RNA polymerase sigma-70 factor, ECF subfamily